MTLPPCPSCGRETLALVKRFLTTNGVLAGSQPKVTVIEWPYLVCPCGFAEKGKIE